MWGSIASVTVGVTVVLFLLKPLFAARPRSAKPFTIDRNQQPVFFAFVDRLCETVGAPKPRRVDVDTDVNASASFRGGLFSLLTRRLVLTVGLPLVSGLTVRQLGGVLAHEFGHFSQGAGMRLTYVIRSINGWFARVVHERDGWDEGLESWAEESKDWRLLALGNIARAGVNASRAVLGVLMRVGHAVSCFTLRQMEFDADRYETLVAGADAFEATALHLPVLGAGSQLAFQDLSQSWPTRQLVDDLPNYMNARAAILPDEAREHLHKEALAQETGLFDTHPSTRDRVDAARRIGADGILADDRGAAALFRDYAALCCDVTARLYAEQLGPDARNATLVELSVYLRSHKDEAYASHAFQLLFREELDVEVATIGAEAPSTEAALPAVADRVQDLRSREIRTGPNFPVWQGLANKEDELGQKAAALSLWRVGRRLDMDSWGIGAKAKREELEGNIAETHAARAELRERCREAIAPALDRIELALGVLSREDLRNLILGGDSLYQDALRWAETLRAIQAAQSPRDVVALSYARLTGIARWSERIEAETLNQALMDAYEPLRTNLEELRSALDTAPHPEVEQDEAPTLGVVLVPEKIAFDLKALHEAAGETLGQIYALQGRALGHLATTTLRAEDAVLEEAGLAPAEAAAGDQDPAAEALRGLAEQAEGALVRLFEAHGGGRPLPEGLCVQPIIEHEAVLPDQCVCGVTFDTRTAAVRDHRFLSCCVATGATPEEARQETLQLWERVFGPPFCAAMAGGESDFRLAGFAVHWGPAMCRGDVSEDWSGLTDDHLEQIVRALQPFLEAPQVTAPVSVDLGLEIHDEKATHGDCRINGRTHADALTEIKRIAWPPCPTPYILRQYLILVQPDADAATEADGNA